MAVAERWRARGTAAYAMYRAASRVVSPLVYLLVRWRRLRGLEHRVRWRERLGEPSAPGQRRVLPSSGSTPSPSVGNPYSEVIKERLPSSVIYQFAPLDTSAAVDKFLGYWNPDAVFLIESELWPNLIFSSAEKGIPLALLNARMSVKSFKLWSKPLAWSLISLMLSKFSLIAPLSTVEAIRFQLLLAPPFIINFGGDLKYAVGDFDVPQKELTILEDLKLQVASRRVWMASSIHYGEEEVVLQVHRELVKIYSNLVTIIVPRHPLHGRQIARALKQQEISVALRSNVERISSGTVIYIVDTLGELRTLYRITPIAVIGGSFLPELSGHNLSEAAAAGCAVLTGPFVGHFSHMIRQMTTLERLSVWQVSGREELEEALKQLLGDAGALEARRRAAKQAFSAVSGGVVGRVWELITAHILREPPQKALESFCLSPDAAGEGRGDGAAGRRAVSEGRPTVVGGGE
ncbi:unnamed protein product [Spirodela intermedia]|uniref:lipid IVA 3-deoxy-D-manno-octulosonic acid transferase n=1 Tax=Spirodela intermedia TaxID=51605 RepID=A0A7I8ICJ8_SPIIN|nr:unnamed protein product [Spirodela intermedia]CAA6655063.1 unnamed protein product [Spirodela intermedia]